MPSELVSRRYPRVPLWRRGAALAVDFVAVALVSSLFSMNAIAQMFLFVVAWLGMRVALVARNQGQSLGRWAFDMKVVDLRWGGTPGLQELAQREGLMAVGAGLMLFGLLNLSPASPWSLLLFIPLGIDCALAGIDEEKRQAFHDQLGRTLVVPTRRGYSLDLKLKWLWALAERRLKQRQ
ncbi:MAG: RDD family protein [Leptolyngbyaceae cyanobacterium bins.302]|nr:RDD family protein [Leptolyngbyaceae cyanobacterium bins.302]